MEDILVVQSLSHVQLFATLWIAARQASLYFTVSWCLPKRMCIESVMLSNHLIFCHPLLLLPSIFPSIRVFSNESALCVGWWHESGHHKYWRFSFGISPSNEYSELISFWIDWFDLLVFQSRVFSCTTIRNYQFLSAQPSLWSNSHIHTWLLEKLKLWLYRPLLAKWCLCCFIGFQYAI